MRIAITADNHLGYRQYGNVSRENDFENALTDIITQCVELDIKYIFVAGDFINVKRPTSRVINFLCETEKTLQKNDQTIYVLQGNHDYCNPSWYSIIEKYCSQRIKTLDNKTISVGKNIRVYGYPEFHKNDFLEKFEQIPECEILLAHTPVKEFIKYPSDSAVSIDDINLNKNFKFIFIGDTHVNQEEKRLNSKNEEVNIISPGSTELCSTNEQTDKYFYTIDTNAPNVDNPDFICEKHQINTRKVLQADINTEEDLEKVIQEINNNKEKEPILVGKYNPEIANVIKRLNVVSGEETINQLKPKLNSSITYYEQNNLVPQLKKPADYVSEIIPENDILNNVAYEIANTKENIDDILDNFVEKTTFH